MWHSKEKGGIAYLKMESQGFVLKCVLGSTTSGNGFGALEKFHDFFEFIFWFLLAKPTLSPCLISEELTFLILYLLATLKFGKMEKFGKCIKVPILFVRGCNFTLCRLNNNIPLLTANSKCYRNIYIKWTE